MQEFNYRWEKTFHKKAFFEGKFWFLNGWDIHLRNKVKAKLTIVEEVVMEASS